MKSKSLFKIATLMTVAGTLVSSVPAMAAVDEYGSENIFYSYEELLEYEKEMDAEKLSLCGEDNFECEDEFYSSHYENDQKFRAMTQITYRALTITAINPTFNNVRVIFNDNDPMSRWMPEELREQSIPEELYIAWYETDPHPFFWEDFRGTPENEGVHILHTTVKRPANDGWLKPFVETEIPISDSTLLLNEPYVIDFGLVTTATTIIGALDYSSCINSPDYFEGAECQIRFGTNEYIYVPALPRKPATSNGDGNAVDASAGDGTNNTDGSDGNSSQANDEPSVTAEAGRGAANDSTGEGIESPDESGAHAAVGKSPSPIKAPNTGTLTEQENDSMDLSWWIILPTIAFSLFTIWLFLPSKKNR